MPSITNHIRGRAYWRSLEEYADSLEFRELLEHEFSHYDPDTITSMSRRRFVKLMGASMALAGLTVTGCRRWPAQSVVPFANRPRGRVPGVPEKYATLLDHQGVAAGLVVTSYDGRPIKIDGNPQHPISRGASNGFAQASILEMYDPDRSRGVVHGKGAGAASSWDAFDKFAHKHFTGLAGDGSGGLAVLSDSSSSPSRAGLRARFLKRFPRAKWYEWEPINRDNEIAGSRLAFGRALRPQYELSRSQVIACFDSDLLCGHPAALKHARDWAAGRRSADADKTMNRLYVAEAAFSTTGSVADHRLPVRPGRIAPLLSALASELAGHSGHARLKNEAEATFIRSLAGDLQASRGRSAIFVGPNQPPEVHAQVCQVNDLLDNLGRTIKFTEEPAAGEMLRDITELTGRINAQEISTLLILGGNPAYDAPADLDFASVLDKVETAIHLSLYRNETSVKCAWHLPKAHGLEAWGDGRAWDGTLSVRQPLILPLFNGRSSIEVLATILGQPQRQGLDIVRRTFRRELPSDRFRTEWEKVLHDGLLSGSAFDPVTARPKPAPDAGPRPAAADHTFEIVFMPDASVFDGRFANNGWLQETPDPLTKITWDNAALINIADARAMDIQTGDVIDINLDNRNLKIAAYLMPGQAAGSITLALGYGRTAENLNVGHRVGFDTYRLRTTGGIGFASGATINKTGRRYKLALTQNHHLIDAIGTKGTRTRVGERSESGTIIKEASLAEYRDDEHFAQRGGHGDIRLQMFEAPHEFNDPHAWGMSVDMSSCIGCNACVVACQAENNVPVVGKDQVLVSREMQWLRIDRYFKNDPKTDPDAERPEVIHQAMMCQQCENAPCEQVCPVSATTHDAEGLNVMVYNRCIGTRYCQNNCPYKVRRFNYFDFHSKDPRGTAKPWLLMPDLQQQDAIDQIKRMVFNPEVTMRMRGVMEKCTYCIQRIARAKSDARVEHARGKRDSERIRDGEIVTACQEACATESIVFGDLNDPDSRVSKLHRNHRAYGVLDDLNTRPRTRYLAKLRNPADQTGPGAAPAHGQAPHA